MTKQIDKYIILHSILITLDDKTATRWNFIINFLIKQHKIDIQIIINQTEIFDYFILAQSDPIASEDISLISKISHILHIHLR